MGYNASKYMLGRVISHLSIYWRAIDYDGTYDCKDNQNEDLDYIESDQPAREDNNDNETSEHIRNTE